MASGGPATGTTGPSFEDDLYMATSSYVLREEDIARPVGGGGGCSPQQGVYANQHQLAAGGEGYTAIRSMSRASVSSTASSSAGGGGCLPPMAGLQVSHNLQEFRSKA